MATHTMAGTRNREIKQAGKDLSAASTPTAFALTNEEPATHQRAAKVAVVIGGGTGIGLATAMRFAEMGVSVGLAGRREEMLRLAADQLRELNPRIHVEYMAGDCGDEVQATATLDGLTNRLGGIDVLVASAGVFGTTEIRAMNKAIWTRTLSATLDAALYPAIAAARLMVPQGSGRIIFISSTSSVLSERGTADYCAAKAAVSSLARSLAVDLGSDGVRVNAVAPGWIETDMVKDFVSNVKPESLAAINALGRLGQPSEVAQLVTYLALDAPDYLTGATIFLDGGQTGMASLP